MKKVFSIIAVIILIVAVLFVPIPKGQYDDGGTRVFTALTYKMVKWNRIYGEGLCYHSTSFYFGEDKNKSIDELWQEIYQNIDATTLSN